MNGYVTSGNGDAAAFIEATRDLLTDTIGFRPYPGTLNLEGVDSIDALPSQERSMPDDDHCCGIVCRPCRVAGIRAAVVRPLVPDYPDEKTELLAPVRLRSLLDLDDGDRLQLTEPNQFDRSHQVVGTELEQFDAIVFDLDDTLLTLDVDWSLVYDEIEAALEPYLEGPLKSYSRSAIFEIARDHDEYGTIETILTDRECDGAETAQSREILELLPELGCSIGVCTANAERAARIALDRFDVLEDVDAIVARDTIAEDKPHPESLLTCVRRLDTGVEKLLYVGDEDIDVELARKTGTSYVHPDQVSVDA